MNNGDPFKELDGLPEHNTTPEPTAGSVKQGIEKESFPTLTNTAEQIKNKIQHDKNRDRTKDLKFNRFEKINKHLDGFKTGFYLIGARENAGKTVFLCNLFLDALEYNKDAIGLFISMDDSKSDIENRFMACLQPEYKPKDKEPIKQLEINDFADPQKLKSKNNYYTDKCDYLETVYTPTTEHLLKLSDRFYIFDSEEVRTLEHIEHLIILIRSQHPDKKIMVFIDSVYSLEMPENDTTTDNRLLHIKRSKGLKQLTKTYDLPLVCSGEIRKESTNDEKAETKAPSTSSIMESGRYAYDANVVFMLWYNKEQKDKEQEENRNHYIPIQVTLSFAKNKLSSYKGKHILNFTTNSAYMTEEAKEQKNDRINKVLEKAQEKEANKQAKKKLTY